MRAGKLRHRVRIQVATESISQSGSVSTDWRNVESRWAEISPIAGGEQVQGEQRIASKTHQVRLRYFDGLTTQHRLLFGTRVLEIVSINTIDEIKREMVLDCRETP